MEQKFVGYRKSSIANTYGSVSFVIKTTSLVVELRATANLFPPGDKEKLSIKCDLKFVIGFGADPLSGNDQMFPALPTVLI